jgi:glycosyltransferase involved in cell wall biosynthesis
LKNKNILFLTLKVFSATGGIEKVCRVAGKVFHEWSVVNNTKVHVHSMYDEQCDADDNLYFPSEIFKGFRTKKIKFIFSSLKAASKYDVIILSHINLLLVGWLVKIIYPKKKIMLFAHGIEIWGKLPKQKEMMIKCCDAIIPVSYFTSQKIQEVHHISPAKCFVLNNCLDPFMPLGKEFIGNKDLRLRYGYKPSEKILFTLTRLSSKERYKGYDKVLEALVNVKKNHPDIKYLIAGSYDEKEKIYITELSQKLGLHDSLILAGFIPDEELVAHFSFADIYIMPSMKEGFGIVFIEAMYYGLPVIAGNKDGSVDALCNGQLGMLVDPSDIQAIELAIDEVLKNPVANKPDKKLLLSKFSYESYKRNFEDILGNYF